MENTPENKADELVENYINIMPRLAVQTGRTILEHAIQCAIIAVDILIKEASENNITIRFKGCTLSDKEYWQSVKQILQSKIN